MVNGARPLDAPLAQLLAGALKRLPMPGVAAGVCRATEVLGLAVSGVRRLGGDESLRITDRLAIGSNAKAFTAMLIATLVEEGTMAWEMTVSDVFPELRAVTRDEHRALTVEQLLMHRARLPPWEDIDDMPQLTGSRREQREKAAAILMTMEPVVAEGEFCYSNAGYGLVGAMAERVVDAAWEELMAERIFAPLGIDGICTWPIRADPAAPLGHYHRDGTFVPHDGQDWAVPAAVTPAGDVSVSVPDNLTFLQAHLSGLSGHGPLLSPETYRRQHRPFPAGTSELGYAHGWVVSDLGNRRTSLHTGGGGTFLAVMAIQPSHDLGVAVVANGGGSEVKRALFDVARDAALLA